MISYTLSDEHRELRENRGPAFARERGGGR